MGQLPQSFTVFLFRFNLQTDLQDRREDMIIPMLYAKRWRLLEHKCSPHITQSPVRQPIRCCNPGFLPPNPAAFYQVSCFHKHSSWAKTLPIHYSIVSGHLKSRNVSQASVSILILERKKQRFCKCVGLLRMLRIRILWEGKMNLLTDLLALVECWVQYQGRQGEGACEPTAPSFCTCVPGKWVGAVVLASPECGSESILTQSARQPLSIHQLAVDLKSTLPQPSSNLDVLWPRDGHAAWSGLRLNLPLYLPTWKGNSLYSNDYLYD